MNRFRVLPVSVGEVSNTRRRSRLVRLLHGAWQLPAAVVFLLNRPSLWPIVILPVVIGVAVIIATLLVAHWSAPSIHEALLPGSPAAPLHWLGRFGLDAGILAASLLVGLGLALLLAAPLLDFLSQRVEFHVRGHHVNPGRGITWDLMQSFRSATYFLVRAPAILLLGLIPVVGPAIATLWAAHSLAFQLTDPTLARHGLDFAERRAWHRRFRAESIGFGLAALVALLIPVANVFLVPVLVVGGTRLALGLSPAVNYSPT